MFRVFAVTRTKTRPHPICFKSVIEEPGGSGGGEGRQLLTGKVVLERSKEVADDGNTPGLPQKLLALLPVHVPHVRVVFGKTEDPERAGGGERWECAGNSHKMQKFKHAVSNLDNF